MVMNDLYVGEKPSNMRTYTKKQAQEKLASYCAMSEKCTYDVRLKLQKMHVEENDQEDIIAYLYDTDFLNDQRYCQYYVNDKFRFNKWGKIKLAAMLNSKQLSSEAISCALDDIDMAEYEETLYYLLRAKAKNMKDELEYQKQGKLYRFAQSRGYELSYIRQIIDRLKREKIEGKL